MTRPEQSKPFRGLAPPQTYLTPRYFIAIATACAPIERVVGVGAGFGFVGAEPGVGSGLPGSAAAAPAVRPSKSRAKIARAVAR
jgi:hypothetical protein